jgi:acyl-CoA synthetase (AMP-forming)/AMP-acid ligase II
VKGVVPNATISTPYGATEALPVTYITAEELATTPQQKADTGEQGTLVGRPVAGVEVAIIKSTLDSIPSIESAQLLSNNTIGEVIVQGANCSPEYFGRDDANKVGKIQDGTGFWHRMGDLGYLDTEGNLYYCGRKSHSVYTAERAFHSVPLEEIFNAHPQVKRTALVGIAGGKEPAIVVEPLPEFWPESVEQEQAFSQELRRIAEQSPLTKSITKFFFHRSFPVDGRHNAKIFREQLQEWADKSLTEQKAA